MADLLERENIRVMQFYKLECFLLAVCYCIYEFLHYRKIEPLNSMECGINQLVQYLYGKFVEESCCLVEGITPSNPYYFSLVLMYLVH
jgi:hypothetical protein